MVEHWLAPIRDLCRDHAEKLSSLGANARVDRVCELNVRAQVQSVCESPIVRDAWERGATLSLHGRIYRLSEGLIRDLQCGRSRSDAG